jgi:hypothetical protein
MENTLIETKALALIEARMTKAFGIMTDGTKIKLRLFKTSYGVPGYFAKGKHKRGYAISSLNLTDLIPDTPKHNKTPEEKWRKAWNKVLSRLQKSGLWESVQKEIETALSIGYETMNKAYDTERSAGSDKEVEVIEAIDTRFVELNDEGKKFVKYSLIWAYAKMPIVKKMHFGVLNESILQQIKEAMEKKQTFHADGQHGYDISFEYNAEKNKAFYSEEFKGCGNGWYYLATDSSHALFFEKD